MTPQNHSISTYVLAVLLIPTSLVACTPAAAPEARRDATPMTEHAAARAEVIYRGYLDALGMIDLTDPAEFERLAELMTPDMYSELSAAFGRLGQDGITTRGRPEVVEFFATQVEGPRMIKAVACTDYSDYEVIDEQGHVISPQTKSPRYEQESMEFVTVGDRLVIGSSFAIPVDECEEILDIDVYEG
jgi:hypothetical protein